MPQRLKLQTYASVLIDPPCRSPNASVAGAVQAGAYVDYPSRLGFYTNHEIAPGFLEAPVASG